MDHGVLSMLESKPSITGEHQIHRKTWFENDWVRTGGGSHLCDVPVKTVFSACPEKRVRLTLEVT